MQLFDYDGTQTEAASLPAWSLTEPQWAAIRRFAAERRYPAGAAILAQDADGDALHIILVGSVDLVVRGRPSAQTERLAAGDAFGLAGFLDGGPSPVASIASSPATLLMLSRAGLDQLASWSPDIAMVLLRDVARQAAGRLRRVGAAI